MGPTSAISLRKVNVSMIMRRRPTVSNVIQRDADSGATLGLVGIIVPDNVLATSRCFTPGGR